MLNDPKATGLVLDLYNHALINPRGNGLATSDTLTKGPRPSYIDPTLFAKGLLDVLQKAGGAAGSLSAGIATIQDPQLRSMLEGMHGRVAGDLQGLQAELSTWFDSGMDRIAGVYKRKTQVFCFVIAMIIVVLLNVDAVQLFRNLWVHPAYMALVGHTPLPSDSPLDQLRLFPIGWTAAPSWDTFLSVPGWLLAASAALFGAPFWFDLLQTFVQLRGTGDKPSTNK
jgi:hypothetical protein